MVAYRMQGNYNVETENGELVNTLSKTLGEPVKQDKDGMKTIRKSAHIRCQMKQSVFRKSGRLESLTILLGKSLLPKMSFICITMNMEFL